MKHEHLKETTSNLVHLSLQSYLLKTGHLEQRQPDVKQAGLEERRIGAWHQNNRDLHALFENAYLTSLKGKEANSNELRPKGAELQEARAKEWMSRKHTTSKNEAES